MSRCLIAASLRPGLHLREQGLRGGAGELRHHVQHEPVRELLRQCGDGKLLCNREERRRRAVESCGDAEMALFDFIEVFYNR